jgi:hypothetical protein
MVRAHTMPFDLADKSSDDKALQASGAGQED